MAEQKRLSNEEVLKELSDKVAGGWTNAFRIKIARRQSGSGGYLVHVATLDGAMLSHVANAEEWLPQLAGGGPIYQIDVYHDQTGVEGVGVVPVGRLTHFIDGRSIAADPAIVKSPDWRGPPIFIKAPENSLPEKDYGQPLHFQTLPGGGAPGDRARGSNPDGSNPGGGSTPPSTISADPEIASLKMQLEGRLRQMDRDDRDRELRSLKRENEAQLSQYQRQIRELEFKIQNAQQAPPQKQGPSAGELIAAVVGAISPLVAEIMKSNNETRLESLRAQQAQAKEFQQLILAMMARPQVDPMMEKILDKFDKMNERIADQKANAFGDFAQVAEAQSSIIRGSVHAMRAVTEALGEEKEDHPSMMIFKEVLKGVQALAEGFKVRGGGGGGGAPAPAPAFAGYPAPAQLPPTAPAVAAASAAAPAPPSAPVDYVPAMPGRAGGNANQPKEAAPAPTPPPHSNGATAAPHAAPAAPPQPTVIDQLEYMIRNYQDPRAVAQLFITALVHQDPSLTRELQAVGNVPSKLLNYRLGEEWVSASPQNGAYAQALMTALEEEGEKAGIYEGEGGDDEEEAEVA